MNNKYICNICHKEFSKLGIHIKKHNITSQDYYDKYIKQDQEGFCVVCNKPTQFIDIINGYKKHCSISCSIKNPETQNKIIQTNRLKYGVDNVFQADSIKNKIQASIYNHYGEAGLANPLITKKKQDTKQIKYNDKNYNNRLKCKQTCLERYGNENVYASEYGKQKCQDTKLYKYGNIWYNNKPQAIKTLKNTLKYRTPEESQKIGQKLSQIFKSFSIEKKQLIANKISIQMKNYYKNLSTDQYKQLCKRKSIIANNRSKESWARSIQKSNNTKRLNQSFCSSKLEDQFYNELLKYFEVNDIVRQYSDDRYTFNCDFYIKSLDLFIEINNHWTHGTHPFDLKNEKDVEKQKILAEKAVTNKYYATALYVWTILDPKKLNMANSNNLNYIQLYNKKIYNNFLIQYNWRLNMKLNQDGICPEDKQLAINVRNYLLAGNRVLGSPGEGLKQTLAKLEKERDNRNFGITDWKIKDPDLEQQINLTKAGIDGESKLAEYLSTLIKYDDKLEGLIAFASLSYNLEDNDKDYIPDTDTLLVYGNNLLVIDAKNIKVKPNQTLIIADGVVMDAEKGKEILEVHPSTHIWEKVMAKNDIQLDSIDGYVCIVGDTPVDIIRDEYWYSCHTKLIHISELREILEEWVKDKDNKVTLKMLTEIAKAQIRQEREISFDIDSIKRKFGI